MRDVEQISTENFAKNDGGAERGAMSQASSAYGVGGRPEMPSGKDSSAGALPPGRADTVSYTHLTLPTNREV